MVGITSRFSRYNSRGGLPTAGSGKNPTERQSYPLPLPPEGSKAAGPSSKPMETRSYPLPLPKGAQPADSGTKPAGPRSVQPSSKQKPKASNPSLKRVNSLPARLPSNALQQTEVKPVRKPITRPGPDTRPPEVFRDAGGPREAAELKMEYMKLVIDRNDIIPKLVKKIENSSYYMDLIKIKHPDIGTYGTKEKYDAYCDLADRHPKLLAWHAKERNRLYTIPNGATSSRTMEPDEQRFLTQACNAIQRHLKENPFHIHGDMGVKGNKEGFLTEFSPNLGKGDSRSYSSIDKYELHTRAPFMGPFTSSASETDHQHAAMLHLFNEIPSYITNGKDILQIQPDSLELVKLHPDPKVEKELRPFPQNFGVPAPQQPPRPFSNHEAPATFGKD